MPLVHSKLNLFYSSGATGHNAAQLHHCESLVPVKNSVNTLIYDKAITITRNCIYLLLSPRDFVGVPLPCGESNSLQSAFLVDHQNLGKQCYLGSL
jgi:hypothetical protein